MRLTPMSRIQSLQVIVEGDTGLGANLTGLNLHGANTSAPTAATSSMRSLASLATLARANHTRARAARGCGSGPDRDQDQDQDQDQDLDPTASTHADLGSRMATHQSSREAYRK